MSPLLANGTYLGPLVFTFDSGNEETDFFKNNNSSNLGLKNFNKKEIYLNDINIGSLISMAYNNYEDLWYGIAIIRLTDLYKFEENNDLECKFQNLKLKIKFPQYMLPLPKKLETS